MNGPKPKKLSASRGKLKKLLSASVSKPKKQSDWLVKPRKPLNASV